MVGKTPNLPASYTGENIEGQQGKTPIPLGTPQIMDNQGNPSQGFTDALTGGMRELMKMISGGGQGAISSDPMTQYRLQNPTDPVIADGYKNAHNINKTVDSGNQLDDEMRHIAGMEQVKEYWDMQGHPEIGDKIAAGMLLHARDISMRYGDKAIKYLYGKNYDKAVDSVVQAYDSTPDGKRLIAEKIGEGQYNVQQRDLRNHVLWQQVVGPREILRAAAGAQSGLAFWHMMSERAAPYDAQSRQELQEQQQAQLAQGEWQPPPIGGTQGGAQSQPTPRVTPAIATGAIPTPGQATPPATQQPQQGRGEATPPAAAPPAASPPPTQVMPSPSAQAPSAAPPQPGPPAVQPASADQPPQLQDVTPQVAAMQQQVHSKYFSGMVPPKPTGNPSLDRLNQQKYNQEVSRRTQLSNQEVQANKADIMANARARAQLQGEEFAAVKQQQSEAAKVRSAAQAPMNDKDLNDTMTNFDAKSFPPIGNMPPAQQRYFVSAVRATQRFNRGMDPNDIADVINGIATNQYSLDPKTKPHTINDENGLRYVVPFVRNDGTRGHITMPEDTFDNMMRAKKAVSDAAKAKAATSSRGVIQLPPAPQMSGMGLAPDTGSTSGKGWTGIPTVGRLPQVKWPNQ